jgi:hypothetical protein
VPVGVDDRMVEARFDLGRGQMGAHGAPPPLLNSSGGAGAPVIEARR